MHIMVVDDEVASRTKMQTLMSTLGVCQTAENGIDAVKLFEQAIEAGKPFQLVTLDIEMPDLRGHQVLEIFRKIERDHNIEQARRARIMMVTSCSDKGRVLACIQTGCDDYITKPFNIKVVRDKVAKLGFAVPGQDAVPDAPPPKKMAADAIFSDINRALRKGDLELPAQPEISIKFRQLVSSYADLDQIADLLQKDMVIAAKVIRTANSALYRGFDVVINITQAVSRIGISNTEQLVTALENQQLYVTRQSEYKCMLEKLWQHSLATAFAADIVAGPKGRDLSIDPFLAGLVHDIGALALIQIVAEMEKRKKFKGQISQDALVETVHSYHTVFGGKLLGKWNFADDYTQAIQNHRNLSADAINEENCIVHIANLMARTAGYAGVSKTAPVDILETAAARYLHMDSAQVDDIVAQLQSRMAEAEDVATLA